MIVCLVSAGSTAWAQDTASIAAPSSEFKQVLGPRDWAFPLDHGKHQGYKTEWWYFSGNLHDKAGRRFGYQLTFFRIATVAQPSTRPAERALSDLYFAHAAISDIQGRNFLFKDRLQRASAGRAESSDRTLDVYLRDWCAKLDDQGNAILVAKDSGFGIDLVAGAGIGPVLQGPGGVNAKGTNPGQASYYYSEPQMPTHGRLTVGAESFEVDGPSWMDHEFSSNAMAPNQVGWDWLALSFPDRSSLMVYRLRNQSGATDYISGTLISPAGQPTYLAPADIKMEGSQPWRSTRTGAAYPQQWRVAIANHRPIVVRALMTGQELVTPDTTDVNYFEGAAEATDDSGNHLADGYVEMTGYEQGGRTILASLSSFLHLFKAIWLTP
jgi:predicted secreted hydrolase